LPSHSKGLSLKPGFRDSSHLWHSSQRTARSRYQKNTSAHLRDTIRRRESWQISGSCVLGYVYVVMGELHLKATCCLYWLVHQNVPSYFSIVPSPTIIISRIKHQYHWSSSCYTVLNLNKCVSRTDTNPPFAFQTAFPGGTDFSVSTERVKKLHTLLVSLYF